jgi:hypothetical protein
VLEQDYALTRAVRADRQVRLATGQWRALGADLAAPRRPSWHGFPGGLFLLQIQYLASAVSSNRIEGVSVEASRIQTVLIATKPLFRDRDEEEIRGYRDALAWIHDHSSGIPLDENACGPRVDSKRARRNEKSWRTGMQRSRCGSPVVGAPEAGLAGK